MFTYAAAYLLLHEMWLWLPTAGECYVSCCKNHQNSQSVVSARRTRMMNTLVWRRHLVAAARRVEAARSLLETVLVVADDRFGLEDAVAVTGLDVVFGGCGTVG